MKTPIQIVLVDLPGGATAEDYQIVWGAAQPFLAALSNIIDRTAKNVGMPITGTAAFTTFARMLAAHPKQDRDAIIATIVHQLSAYDAQDGDDEDEGELPGEHPLVGLATQGNA